MNANRKKAEALIYKFFDAIDPSKANSQFYKEMFSGMSNSLHAVRDVYLSGYNRQHLNVN